ncbi:MAG: hypothetical protein JSS66_03195 [Armatimonadetes bacterium]|nr:hypothetical protein [Armatimonadota bacterium]
MAKGKPSLLFAALAVTFFTIGCSSPDSNASATTGGGTTTTTTGGEAPKDTKSETPTATAVDFEKDVKPVIEATCIKCHSGPEAKGHIDMTLLKTNDDAKANKAMIEKMAKEVEEGKMPPPKIKTLTEDERTKIATMLKSVASM